MTDRKIIDGIKKHDEKAFEMLVDSYGGLIKSIVSFHMRSFREYQEECVNDILLSIWQNIKSYDESRNTLKNWIGAICRYKAIDYKRKYYKTFMVDALDENVPDLKNAFENDIADETESILSCLKKEDREIFYRHYILGEKITEIAETDGRSPGVLFNRLSRGRNKIRNTFKGVIYK
jgi:RNA polymerase sigma-70 factor (ECF subfamily)